MRQGLKHHVAVVVSLKAWKKKLSPGAGILRVAIRSIAKVTFLMLANLVLYFEERLLRLLNSYLHV